MGHVRWIIRSFLVGTCLLPRYRALARASELIRIGCNLLTNGCRSLAVFVALDLGAVTVAAASEMENISDETRVC